MNDSKNGNSKGGSSTTRHVLVVAVGLVVAVAILTAVADNLSSREMGPPRAPPLEVETAIHWMQAWLGFVFVLLSPFVAFALYKLGTLAWTVLPGVALFLAGAALLGLGSWGPFVGLSVIGAAVGAVAIVERKT